MKKVLLITAVLLTLVVGFSTAAPLVAGTEGSSELTFGFITGPDGTKTRYTNLIWTTVANIDKNNYILFGVKGNNTPDLTTFGLRAFSGNMILDSLLGLPDGTLKLKFGIDDVIAYNAPPSGYAYENQMGYDPGPRPTFAALGKLGPVNYRVSYDPGMTFTDFGLPVTPRTLLANIYGNIGPFLVSGAYWSNGQIFEKGKLGAELGWSTAVGNLGLAADAEYSYDMLVNKGTIGLAGVVRYGWLSVDASTNYTEPTATNTAGFNALGFGIEAKPDVKLQRYGASLGIDVNMNPQVAEPIRSIDGSVWLKALGPGKLRAGYLYTKTGNGGGDYYAPAALPNGGVYVKYDMSW